MTCENFITDSVSEFWDSSRETINYGALWKEIVIKVTYLETKVARRTGKIFLTVFGDRNFRSWLVFLKRFRLIWATTYGLGMTTVPNIILKTFLASTNNWEISNKRAIHWFPQKMDSCSFHSFIKGLCCWIGIYFYSCDCFQ